jgi:hypothetical protein
MTGKKEVIYTTRRTLQGVTFPAYPSLRKTAGAPGEKTLKIPTIGAQEIKTLTQNNSRLHKSQCRMKEQDNGSPSKANSTTKDLNTCIQEEISSNEFQDTIIN